MMNKIVHVPRALACAKIPGLAKSVAIFLRSLANKDLQCWVKHATVMKELGIAHDRALRRAIAQLRDAGVLEVLPQFRRFGGGQSSNIYQLSAFFWEVKNDLPSPRTNLSAPIKLLNAVPRTKRKKREETPRTRAASLPSAAGGGEKPTPTPGTPVPPTISTPSAPPSVAVVSGVDVLLDHWRAVFQAKRGLASPVNQRMRWIFRDLLGAVGMAGAKAAVDLWFEKEYRSGFDTFAYPWCALAREGYYDPVDFERSLFKIIQHRRFAEYKAKHGLLSEVTGEKGEKREKVQQEERGASSVGEGLGRSFDGADQVSDGERAEEAADEVLSGEHAADIRSLLGGGFLRTREDPKTGQEDG